MKKRSYIFLTSLFISLFIVGSGFIEGNVKKKIRISGKVLNCDPKIKTIGLFISKIGFRSQYINASIGTNNTFVAAFESYIPTDIWVLYNTNFTVLAHPGDRIYFEFDGRQKTRTSILKTIKFKGDRQKTNRDVAVFQYLFYSSPLYYDWGAHDAIKKFKTKQYIGYLNSRKKEWQNIYSSFIQKYNPDADAKTWASMHIDRQYYNDLAYYPYEHRQANNLSKKDWDVPISYYTKLLNKLPIKRSMFIAGSAISKYINSVHFRYVREKIKQENLNVSKANWKSTYFNGIIKHVNDPLLRQLILTEFLSHDLNKLETGFFEGNIESIKKNITEPFLINPLMKLCYGAQYKLKNPETAKNTIVKNTSDISIQNFLDKILRENRGKIIYIDFWATWCKPCLEELPKSKKMIEKFKNNNVAFVFICLDSKRKIFRSMINQLKIGGQHYYLNKVQSRNLRQSLKINAIPHYILIDKNGVMVGKGFHLRPEFVQPKIERMLKK